MKLSEEHQFGGGQVTNSKPPKIKGWDQGYRRPKAKKCGTLRQYRITEDIAMSRFCCRSIVHEHDERLSLAEVRLR